MKSNRSPTLMSGGSFLMANVDSWSRLTLTPKCLSSRKATSSRSIPMAVEPPCHLSAQLYFSIYAYSGSRSSRRSLFLLQSLHERLSPSQQLFLPFDEGHRA